jgi:murein DD-endopeptidase MepM/ murein hydrolase activator NlpD
LQGLQLQELNDIVTNPFEAPRPGQDDKHHGVDLAFYRHGDLTTMKGLPIQSVLAGKVAAVVTDSKPYGNMVIIESPYSTLPPHWLKTLQLPNQVAPLEPLNTTLSCPNLTAPSNWDPTKLSLYLLYAHMLAPSDRLQGESIQCGQQIGQVGTSGNSVNEHLHLEVRVGPSDATFSGLGHYDTHLTDEERSNYCLWRISGWFQMLDPMQLINLQP